jgi:hypothetical protein
MAEKLDKILKIEDTDYEITAVYSDIAGRVTKPLIIKESNTKVGEFYGSDNTSETTKSEINYVPATGGAFVGSVYHTDSLGNKITEAPTDNELVTSSQVEQKIKDFEISTLSSLSITENDYQLTNLKQPSSDTIYKLLTITGTTKSFKLLQDGSAGLTFTGMETDPYPVSGQARITGYSGKDSSLIIPYIIDNKLVTAIGTNAFKNCNGTNGKPEITKVLIPDSINTIESEAFSGCTKLISVNIPASVELTDSSTGVFSGCTGLTTAKLDANIDTNKLPNAFFYDCTNLNTVVIPKNIKRIGMNAFYGCTNLKTINFTGTIEEWNEITIDKTNNGNSILNSIQVNVNYRDLDDPTQLNILKILNNPIIYICKDTETTGISSSAMYLKLPGINDFVETSTHATHLKSTLATSESYYTYEGLAEIIARINLRLDVLGIGVKETITAPLLSLKEVDNLVGDEIEIKESDFDPDKIPTIQDLSDGLKLVKADLADLIAEVEFELEQNPENPSNLANSRIDRLELGLTPVEHVQIKATNNTTGTENEGTLTIGAAKLNQTSLAKILDFIDLFTIAEE